MKARFGQFEVDVGARELRKGGIRVKIHEQPFQVLEALLERPGEIVTRDELRRRMWPDTTFVDFDQSLNKAVNRLRAALSDNATNPRFVETLSRRGYRLLVPVEPFEATVLKSETAPPPRRIWPWALTSAFVVVLATIAFWLMPRRIQIKSIAVLPLTNLSGNPGEEYFVDGMTDAITTDLARIPGLRVVSTTSAMHYKAAKKPVPVVARELGVDGVIEGALRRNGNRIQMSLKLIDARAERPLWVESYESDVQDIARVQSDVVRLVASAMQITLNPERQHELVRTRKVQPEALDNYLRGYALAQQRTEGALNKSVEHFEKAIHADPSFARGYVGMVMAYQFLASYHLRPSYQSYQQQAVFANKALELDSTIPEGHTLLAIAKLYGDWDWRRAEAQYKRALELSPTSNAMGHQRYALALMWMGRFDEALSEIRVAQELDPIAVINRANEAEIYYNSRQYERAIEEYVKAIRIDPKFFNNYQFLGLAYAGLGRYDEGLRAVQTAISLGCGPECKGKMGYVLARAGRVDQAKGLVNELRSMRPAYAPEYDIATIYAGLGDRDHAFEWLEKSYQDHSRQMVYLGVAPVLDGLRSDPRFSVLVRKVGLVP